MISPLLQCVHPRTSCTPHTGSSKTIKSQFRLDFQAEHSRTLHPRTAPLIHSTSFKPNGSGRDTFQQVKANDDTVKAVQLRSYPPQIPKHIPVSNINSIHNIGINTPGRRENPGQRRVKTRQLSSMNRLAQPFDMGNFDLYVTSQKPRRTPGKKGGGAARPVQVWDQR
jgi:hypothetical protein